MHVDQQVGKCDQRPLLIDGCIFKGKCTIARRGTKTEATRVDFTVKHRVDKQLTSLNLDMALVNLFSKTTMMSFQKNGLLLSLLLGKISFNQDWETIRGSQMGSTTYPR